jgi:transcriptional regulator with XRE-family HTH domain
MSEGGGGFGLRLRRARERVGLSQSRLALHAGISRSRLAKFELGTQEPRLSEAVRLADVLAELGADAPAALLLGTDTSAIVGPREALEFTDWITSSNTTDDAIAYLDAATSAAARNHLYRPPRVVLSKVVSVHRRLQSTLREGRQMARQTRALLAIDTRLLAHTCLLLGDLHRDEAAAAYGEAARLAAREAGCSAAEAYCAQAQMARWRHRYAEAAESAAEGYAVATQQSLRVLLACQEANAAALARDRQRMRRALTRAEENSVEVEPQESTWACPPARHALYRLSVRLHSGDPEGALREAEPAESWEPGQPRPFGSWAHVRTSAAIAHLALSSVDGAAEQLRPLLELAPEYRMTSVTAHLEDVATLLRQTRYADARDATLLRDQIATFMRGARSALI